MNTGHLNLLIREDNHHFQATKFPDKEQFPAILRDISRSVAVHLLVISKLYQARIGTVACVGDSTMCSKYRRPA